jgi:hypothetical protein
MSGERIPATAEAWGSSTRRRRPRRASPGTSSCLTGRARTPSADRHRCEHATAGRRARGAGVRRGQPEDGRRVGSVPRKRHRTDTAAGRRSKAVVLRGRGDRAETCRPEGGRRRAGCRDQLADVLTGGSPIRRCPSSVRAREQVAGDLDGSGSPHSPRRCRGRRSRSTPVTPRPPTTPGTPPGRRS